MIKEKLKQCLKSKQKNKRNGVENHGEHDAICEEMVVGVSTSDRCLHISKLQSLLDKTRPLHQKKINKMSASDILKMYPALRNPELIHHVFFLLFFIISFIKREKVIFESMTIYSLFQIY